jgi:hypothetical protein
VSKLTPEEAAERLATAVNNVEKALRGVVRVADAEVLDIEALKKIEAFITNRTGDLVRDLGLLMASRSRGKSFSLDAPVEAFDAPRTVLTVRPDVSPPRLGPYADGIYPQPLTADAVALYEQRRQLGGRLLGTPKKIVSAAMDDDDGVDFIDED